MIWLILSALSVARCGCQIASTGVEWPSGSYGLPRPKSGCPSDRKNGWYEGWRFQDMEDDSKKSTSDRSSASSGSHMDIKFIGNVRDVNRTFCMKQNTGTQTRYWPKGSYCIYQHKDESCPNDMDTGWVRWDDEDYKNKNEKGGSLPDGSYDTDTLIYYCCQTAGHWYNSIELPVSRPFYLLTSSSNAYPKCQMVKWAFSYLEYIAFDTNDQSNGDDERGEHVFLHGRKLYYCYYEDCRRTLTRPSDSFGSHPETHQHSQYCSWLITIAETYIVSLNFKELTISNCDDMFLRIYDGSNDTAPLMGTYCGLNASTELEITSSTKHLYIVSNSGIYDLYPDSIFSFYAQYKAEHLTGCHHEVIGSTGFIKSPKFDTPTDYPRHSNCSWLVTVDDAYMVALNFSFLKLHDNDFIEIYDGDNETAPVLARFSSANVDQNNCSLVSSSNMVYIILKYGKSSGYYTEFALDYDSQPKPTEKSRTLQTTSTSTSIIISTVQTQEPNRETAKQSKSNQTTYIIVAVVVSVAVVLVLIAIFIFLRRRKMKTDTSSTSHRLNPSYSLRINARTTDEDSVHYANPSSPQPQESVWIGNNKICKESKNPIYEPSDIQEPAHLYASTDNTSEPLVENQGRTATSENPLYGVGDLSINSHVYAEPISQKQNVVYDEPDVKV